MFPDKYIEVRKPVSKKTVARLDKICADMEARNGINQSQGTHILHIGSDKFEKDGNKEWVKLVNINNPEFNPDTKCYAVIHGRDKRIQAECPEIAMVRYCIGMTKFHNRMMKLFRLLNWTYESTMQCEATDEKHWNDTRFPRYDLATDGTITKL